MALPERSRQLAIDAIDLKAREGMAEQVRAVSARAEAFELALGELRAAVGRMRLLIARGVPVTANLKAAPGTRRNVAEWRVRVASDPAVVVAGGGDVLPQMLNPAKALTKSMTEATAAAWGRHVKNSLPAVTEEHLNVRAKIPAQKTKVDEFRQLRDRALSLAKATPTHAAEMDLFEVYRDQCLAAWRDLDSDGLPPDVGKLLRDAGTPAGAVLDLITPATLEWLKANGLYAKFRVRF